MRSARSACALTVLTVVLAAAPATSNDADLCFTVHPNGDSLRGVRSCAGKWEKDGGMDHMLEVLGPEVWCLENKNCDVSLFLPRSGVRLHTEGGSRVQNLRQIPRDGDVYVVPKGLQFAWPTKHTGWSFEPQTTKDEHPIPGKNIRLTQLSDDARVFDIENFVSAEEVAALLAANSKHLQKSAVVSSIKSSTNTNLMANKVRNSSHTWDKGDLAQRVMMRAFKVLGWEHYDRKLADGLQVVNYKATEWYKPHVDWFGKGSFEGYNPLKYNGTNRFATVLVYLNTPASGGQTVFPLSKTHAGYNGEQIVEPGTERTPGFITEKDAAWACNPKSTALRAPAVAGNAVLFYNQLPNGALSKLSLHGGCPPTEGVKWAANVWIWNRPKGEYDATGAAKHKKKRNSIQHDECDGSSQHDECDDSSSTVWDIAHFRRTDPEFAKVLMAVTTGDGNAEAEVWRRRMKEAWRPSLHQSQALEVKHNAAGKALGAFARRDLNKGERFVFYCKFEHELENTAYAVKFKRGFCDASSLLDETNPLAYLKRCSGSERKAANVVRLIRGGTVEFEVSKPILAGHELCFNHKARKPWKESKRHREALEVRDSDEPTAGKGLFARREIQKGERFLYYGNFLRQPRDVFRSWAVSTDAYLDGSGFDKPDNPLTFVNFAVLEWQCDSINAKVVAREGVVEFEATQLIDSGKEIWINQGQPMAYRLGLEFECDMLIELIDSGGP